jgi:branched-chain amino acid transport system permease protein
VLGINVARYKLTAFVLSAVYASIAGSYFALFDGFVTPDTSSFLRSIEFVVMAVLGGSARFSAALSVPPFWCCCHNFSLCFMTMSTLSSALS